MATIVRHKATDATYILVGTGFGAYQSARPGRFLGDLMPTEDSGQIEMVAVCDENGRLFWARSEDVYVVEIDGKRPSELLRDSERRMSSQEHAPVTDNDPVSDGEIEQFLDSGDSDP